MNVKRFQWGGAAATAYGVRAWAASTTPPVDVASIQHQVAAEGDTAILRLTAELDATENPPTQLRVDPAEAEAALADLAPPLREALDIAAANVRAVAAAQLVSEPLVVDLPQGQEVTVRELAVGAAGIYAPGGRAAYPSSVLMCAIPAQVAGVGRIALASPPGPDGRLHRLVLAAAALCGVEEIYGMGGAQAVFALAYGTATIPAVDLIAGPGNAWVREAKRAVYGWSGIDSLAGPSELMVIAGEETDPEWVAMDLCAQAEHGVDSPLLVVAVEERLLEAIATAADAAAASRPGVADAPLALVQVGDLGDAVEMANLYAPEHLQLFGGDAALLAERITTAGCVFVGRFSATAFGDYVAGSNHVLPTAGAGRFSGPLGPATFRRRISTVEVSAEAASKLASHADEIARAEGFPVHGESAMIRAKP